MLKEFLISKADELAPIDPKWPDNRDYAEQINPDALTDKWLQRRTSYIWKVGVLAQTDSNKTDYARLFIGHERTPGQPEFIGVLYWHDGENDDIGRCLPRYVACAQMLSHPVFHDD